MFPAIFRVQESHVTVGREVSSPKHVLELSVPLQQQLTVQLKDPLGVKFSLRYTHGDVISGKHNDGVKLPVMVNHGGICAHTAATRSAAQGSRR